MVTYILLSGFDWEKGFFDTVAQVILRCVTDTQRLLFIASDPGGFEKTDKNTRVISGWFERIGIVFGTYDILDRRMPDKEQANAIARASCIFLCGGDTLAQINYLKTQNLIEPLRKHNGLIIGISAGAINMAKRSVLLVNPYREHTWVYEGIGLVDVTITPHFDTGREEFIKTEILPLTYDGTIYGMCDDGAIVIQNGVKQHTGKIFEMAHGHMRLLSNDDEL